MDKKILTSNLLTLLEKNKIEFELEEDKRRMSSFISLFPDKILFSNENPFLIEIHKSFILLNILGWQVIDRYNNYEEIKTSRFYKMLLLFLNKEIKVRIEFSKGRAQRWKVFQLQENRWMMTEKHSRLFYNPFTRKEQIEISIDDFIKGESHA